MKSRLFQIPLTIVRLDNILISRKNTFYHRQNLLTVLKNQINCGLKYKKNANVCPM